MASPPSTLPSVLADRWEVGRWPASLGKRTFLRAGLCVPYVVLAAWLAVRGTRFATAVQLERAGHLLGAGSGIAGYLSRAYPPVPVGIARLLPGGAPALAFVGALCAGGVLHLCWERMVRAQLPRWLVVTLLVVLGGSPVFWFNATENLVGFLGIACFAVAITGMLDFLYQGRTSGGYAAGLVMAAAVLCDPASLAYAASVLVAVPFLAWERFVGERYSIRSALAVFAFPTVAVLAGWAFLEWRFTGAVWHPVLVAPDAFRFPVGILGGLRAAASQVGWQVLCSPLYVLSAVLVLPRRPIAFLGLLVVPLDLVVAAWLGLHGPTTQGLVLLDLVGVLALPTRPGPLTSAVVAIEAVAGAATALILADAGGTGALLHALGL